jgi:hypothetical protein
MRKAQDVIPLGLLDRERDQRLELRITAHDAVQGHDLGRLEFRSKAHEVAVAELYTSPVTAARGLLFGRGDIGRCRFDMDSASDTAPQQFMVKDADASSDIEECQWRDG